MHLKSILIKLTQDEYAALSCLGYNRDKREIGDLFSRQLALSSTDNLAVTSRSVLNEAGLRNQHYGSCPLIGLLSQCR